MTEITIKQSDGGQRFDKYLFRYLNKAPKSFVYKMLRKKNILLNGKKSDGSTILKDGDVIRLFLSDDTLLLLSEHKKEKPEEKGKNRGQKKESNKKTAVDISKMVLYEDRDILLINKPAGILVQRSEGPDSLTEYVRDYLNKNGYSEELFKSSPANRIDRNTTGIVMFGKTMAGLQYLTDIIRDKSAEKIYYVLVKGRISRTLDEYAYLSKDGSKNTVTVRKYGGEGYDMIHTSFSPVCDLGDYTLLEARLFTGKTHQIRAHLAFLGFPVVGDKKYGNGDVNRIFAGKYHLKSQFLHSYKTVFPESSRYDEYLDSKETVKGMAVTAPLPEKFERIINCLKRENKHGRRQEDKNNTK
ncbi:MAG: RluA family pseudouridine synthase [Lachnospiraceae bacterium]|jgi:23S rRNA pseudouridine955/2504/2580 synthase